MIYFNRFYGIVAFFFILANASSLAFSNHHSQDAKVSTAQSMERQGMVNIKSVDPTIEVSLMYARKDNFTGQVLCDQSSRSLSSP